LRPRKADQAKPSCGARANQRRHPLALGIERIGLVSLRFPLAVALVAVALAIAAGFGAARLKIDDSLSQLFRSDTPEFKQYEEVTRRFPSSEFDVLVVIEGKKLLERESVEKLRDLVTDLQLIDGTRGVISMFSARQPPENGAIPAPLFADQLPEGALCIGVRAGSRPTPRPGSYFAQGSLTRCGAISTWPMPSSSP